MPFLAGVLVAHGDSFVLCDRACSLLHTLVAVHHRLHGHNAKHYLEHPHKEVVRGRLTMDCKS